MEGQAGAPAGAVDSQGLVHKQHAAGGAGRRGLEPGH